MTVRKISLREMYDELRKQPSPSRKFIRELAELTNRSELTVRLWLTGHHEPEPLITQIIASAYGLDPNTLFPKSDSHDEYGT